MSRPRGNGRPITQWTDMSPLATNDQAAAREAARIGSLMLLERIGTLLAKMEGQQWR